MNSMRPTGHHSRVSVSDARGDSIPAGQARVRLKLGAIAYAHSQVGISASIDIAGAALEVLCDAAVHYWEVITGRKFDRAIDHAAATKLRVAALAYVNSRYGVDATQEMARAGMAILCEASILFCESHQAR
jgi:hypothetical protein